MASKTSVQMYVALSDDELEQLRILAIKRRERPSKLIGDAVRKLLAETKGKK